MHAVLTRTLKMNEDVTDVPGDVGADGKLQEATTGMSGDSIMETDSKEPNDKNKDLISDEVALTNLENKLNELHTMASKTENGTASDKAENSSQQSDSTNIVTGKAEETEGAVLPAVRKPKPLTPCEEKQVALAWSTTGVQRCPVCKFLTDDTAIFENHITTCTPPRLPADTEGSVKLLYKDSLYKCVTCMITWKNRAEFEEHIVCHMLSDPYLCITCMKTFKSRVEIEQHAKQVHARGESRCGLKGMKKGRKIVKTLEENGSSEFRGLLAIPKTPRNQIKASDQSAATSTGPNTVPAIVPTKNDQTPKSDSSSCPTPAEAVSKKEIIQSSKETNIIGLSNLPVTVSDTEIRNTVSDISSATSTSSFVTTAASTAVTISSSSSSKTGRSKTISQVENQLPAEKKLPIPKEKPPQYHVKHFTEYTKTPPSSTQAVAVQSPQMLVLSVGGPTPVGPIFQVDPATQYLVPAPVQFQSAKADQMNVVVTQAQNTAPTVTDVQKRTSIAKPVEQTKFPFIAPKFQLHTQPQFTPVALPSGHLVIPQPPTAGKPSRAQMAKPIVHSPVSLQTFPLNRESNSVQHHSGVEKNAPQESLQKSLVAPSGILSTFSVQTSCVDQGVTQSAGTNVTQTSAPTSQMQQNTSPIRTETNTSKSKILRTEECDVAVFKEKFNIPVESSSLSDQQISTGTRAMDIRQHPPPTYNEAVKTLIERDKNGQYLNVAAVNVPSETSNPKKFLFRIKPGQGFVCEDCRKFTKDEIVFRRHVWEHFHQQPLACKTCHVEKIMNKDFLGCLLVNDVVLSLLKMADSTGTQEKSANLADEVISISDDEGEKEQNSKNSRSQQNKTETKEQEIIILEDDDTNKMQLKIESSYSLSETASSKPTSASASDETKNKNKIHVQTEERISEENLNELQQDKNKMDEPLHSGISQKYHGSQISSFVDKQMPTLSREIAPTLESIVTHSKIEKIQNKPLDENLGNKTGGLNMDTAEMLANEQLNTEKKKPEQNKQTDIPSSHQSTITRLEEKNVSVPSIKIHISADKILSCNGNDRIKFESEVLQRQKSSAFYICGMENCGYACLTSQKFREHLNSKHAGAYTFVCCHCGAKDYNDDAHVRHMYSHANAKVFLLYTCPVRLCKYKTNLVHMYGEHLKCHKPEDLNIKCVFCHQVFSDVATLVLHLKDNLLKFVNCPHCSFKFVNKAVVMKHIQLSHPDKPRMVGVTSQIVCLEREINFYVPPSIGPTEVPITVKDIPDAAKIDIPAMLDRVDTETNQTTEKMPQQTEPRKIVNKISDKVDKELRVMLDRNSVINWKDKEVNLKCPHCSYLCYNQRFYREHVAMHTDGEEPDRSKRYVCMYCTKSTNDVAAFKTHMSNHIGKHELKIYSCTLCAYQSNQRYNIMDHIQDGHSGGAQYTQVIDIVKSNEETCRYCNFKSRHAEHVLQHEKGCPFQNLKDKSTPVTANKAIQKHVPETNKIPLTSTTSKIQLSRQCGQENSEKTSEKTRENESESKKLRKYHCHYCSEFFKHKLDLKVHLENDHIDTANKQFSTFKCKYCHYTSTMKEVIVTHMNRKHEGQEVRILRRIETVESKQTPSSHDNQPVAVTQKEDTSEKTETGDNESANKNNGKEEIVIPDGNVFAQPFKCTKCSFTHKIRLSVMRHIKEHPELFPVRETHKLNVSKKPTARKSTSGAHEQSGINQSHQATPHQRAGSVENPFKAVKKIVSSMDEAEAAADKQKCKDHYVLGGDELHRRLSACFLPLEKELGFRCRICQQKIAKQFVLHRHVLDHLNVVFYKCCYCEEGSIEQTLLLGHIHNQHPLKPVQFVTVEKTEINAQLRDKIACQNFNDTLSLLEHNERSGVDYAEKTGLVKKPIHEPPTTTTERARTVTPSSFKCHLCNYSARKAYFLNLHLKGHKDPTKRLSCSVCGYRSAFHSDVMRHIRNRHTTNAVVVDESDADNKSKKSTENNAERQREIRSPSVESQSSKASVSSRQKGKNDNGLKNKKTRITSKVFYEMRQIFKCIDCGEKRHSKGAVYDHFRRSKCSRTWYRCVYCNFQRPTKTDIRAHSRIRHSGKKFGVNPIPMSAKIKEIKIPICYSEKKVHEELANKQTPIVSSAPYGSKTEVYKCEVCHKYTCDSMMKLQFHFNTKHEGKQVQCKQCIYRTPLIKHMINHCKNLHMQDTAKYALVSDLVKTKSASKIIEGNDTPTIVSSEEEDDNVVYTCTKCEYVALVPSVLKAHMKIHLNYKPYCCKYCDLRFKVLKYIKKHIEKVHVGKVMKYSVQKDDSMEARLDKMLEQSKKRRERELKINIKNTETNRKKRAVSESDGESPIKKVRKTDSSSEKSATDDVQRPGSNTEDDTCRFRVALDNAGGRLFQCIHCEFKANKKVNLRAHMRKKHLQSSRSMFKCWYCDYASHVLSNVYRHMGVRHPGRAMRAINNKTNEILSPKSSPVKGKGTPHIPESKSTPHTKTDTPPLLPKSFGIDSVPPATKSVSVLSFTCSICDTTIKGLHNFRQHLTLHKGFKYIIKQKLSHSRLACGYCCYEAKDNNDFSEHITTHLEERRYKCWYCSYTSFTQCVLSKHHNSRHPDDPFKMVDTHQIQTQGYVLLVNVDPVVKLLRCDDFDFRIRDSQVQAETTTVGYASRKGGRKANIDNETNTVGSSQNQDLDNLDTVLSIKKNEEICQSDMETNEKNKLNIPAEPIVEKRKSETNADTNKEEHSSRFEVNRNQDLDNFDTVLGIKKNEDISQSNMETNEKNELNISAEQIDKEWKAETNGDTNKADDSSRDEVITNIGSDKDTSKQDIGITQIECHKEDGVKDNMHANDQTMDVDNNTDDSVEKQATVVHLKKATGIVETSSESEKIEQICVNGGDVTDIKQTEFHKEGVTDNMHANDQTMDVDNNTDDSVEKPAKLVHEKEKTCIVETSSESEKIEQICVNEGDVTDIKQTECHKEGDRVKDNMHANDQTMNVDSNTEDSVEDSSFSEKEGKVVHEKETTGILETIGESEKIEQICVNEGNVTDIPTSNTCNADEIQSSFNDEIISVVSKINHDALEKPTNLSNNVFNENLTKKNLTAETNDICESRTKMNDKDTKYNSDIDNVRVDSICSFVEEHSADSSDTFLVEDIEARHLNENHTSQELESTNTSKFISENLQLDGDNVLNEENEKSAEDTPSEVRTSDTVSHNENILKHVEKSLSTSDREKDKGRNVFKDIEVDSQSTFTSPKDTSSSTCSTENIHDNIHEKPVDAGCNDNEVDCGVKDHNSKQSAEVKAITSERNIFDSWKSTSGLECETDLDMIGDEFNDDVGACDTESQSDRDIFKDVDDNKSPFETDSNLCDPIRHLETKKIMTQTLMPEDSIEHSTNSATEILSVTGSVEKATSSLQTRNIFDDIKTGSTVGENDRVSGIHENDKDQQNPEDANIKVQSDKKRNVFNEFMPPGSMERPIENQDSTNSHGSGVGGNPNMSVEDIISDINRLQDTASAGDCDSHTQVFISSSQPFDTENTNTNSDADKN